MQLTRQESRRNVGIDLLRIIATGMIIAHHFICHGGLSAMFPRLSRSDIFYQSLNIVCYCAVNLYGLISGYLGVGSRFRISRLIGLWLQVVFTGLVITAGFMLFGGLPFSVADLLSSFMPLSFNTYWYFTAYFGMSALLPMLHKALDTASKRTYLCTLGAAFALFCLLPLPVDQDPFHLQYGYHIVWVTVLYVTGYYCKRFGFGRLGRYAVPVYLGCMVLAFISRVVLEMLDMRGITQAPPIVLLEKYTSPTLYLGSIALLSLFVRLQLKGRAAGLIAAISPLTFGVYLFHVHPLVYDRLIFLSMVPFGGLTFPALVGVLVVVCAGVYLLCLGLDWLRLKLFELLRVKHLTQRLEKKLLAWMELVLPEETAEEKTTEE
jgi:surface polysaccharide O-acyltransferase-like enzyme